MIRKWIDTIGRKRKWPAEMITNVKRAFGTIDKPLPAPNLLSSNGEDNKSFPKSFVSLLTTTKRNELRCYKKSPTENLFDPQTGARSGQYRL